MTTTSALLVLDGAATFVFCAAFVFDGSAAFSSTAPTCLHFPWVLSPSGHEQVASAHSPSLRSDTLTLYGSVPCTSAAMFPLFASASRSVTLPSSTNVLAALSFAEGRQRSAGARSRKSQRAGPAGALSAHAASAQRSQGTPRCARKARKTPRARHANWWCGRCKDGMLLTWFLQVVPELALEPAGVFAYEACPVLERGRHGTPGQECTRSLAQKPLEEEWTGILVYTNLF